MSAFIWPYRFTEGGAPSLYAPKPTGLGANVFIPNGVYLEAVDVSGAVAGAGPITFALAPGSGPLPPGVSLSQSGHLYGFTPADPGVWSIDLLAQNSGGSTTVSISVSTTGHAPPPTGEWIIDGDTVEQAPTLGAPVVSGQTVVDAVAPPPVDPAGGWLINGQAVQQTPTPPAAPEVSGQTVTG